MRDLNQALELNPKSTNTLIKRASVHFEKKDAESCFQDFEKAISINPDDADVYYHRGQAHFIMGDLNGAMDDYKKSVELDSTVPFGVPFLPFFPFDGELMPTLYYFNPVLVQLAVIYFRTQAIQSSIDTFKSAVEKFPQYGDLYNYYGEVLTELQKYDEASDMFEKGKPTIIEATRKEERGKT